MDLIWIDELDDDELLIEIQKRKTATPLISYHHPTIKPVWGDDMDEMEIIEEVYNGR